MKKNIVPVLLLIIISILGFANYIYPLIAAILHKDSLSFSGFRYAFVITSYICIIITVWINNENLALWNIDRLSLLTLALVALFVRVNLHIPYEEYYKNLIKLLGLFLLVISAVYWKKIPHTSARWAFIGILSCSVVIFLALIESAVAEKYAYSNTFDQTKFFSYAIPKFLYTLSFVAPFEEVTVRAILWGQLRKWNMDDRKIIWVQGLLFWSFHIWQLATPITFLLGIPISILIYSLLVKYSKQIFPSIVSHTLINTLLPIVMSIYF